MKLRSLRRFNEFREKSNLHGLFIGNPHGKGRDFHGFVRKSEQAIGKPQSAEWHANRLRVRRHDPQGMNQIDRAINRNQTCERYSQPNPELPHDT